MDPLPLHFVKALRDQGAKHRVDGVCEGGSGLPCFCWLFFRVVLAFFEFFLYTTGGEK